MPARLRRLLGKAGRRRHLDRDVARLREVFTDTYLRQPPRVENAMGIQLGALLRQFDAACAAADKLAVAAIAHFEQHRTPRSSPASPAWDVAGARVLAKEIGDDRTLRLTPRELKRAGSAPITRASGKKTVVLHRISRTGAWPPSARSGLWHRCAPRGRASP